MSSTSHIGLFYGSSTCYTEFVAEKIVQAFGDQWIDMHKVGDASLMLAQNYSCLIFGIPTWDYGELQEDWENNWSELDKLDLSNKKLALYGVGDQVGYPEWFLDALGYLHDKALTRGADIVGYWPNEGYEFAASRALTEDERYFVGLAIDEENQFELTDERVAVWVAELKQIFQTS